MLEINNFLTNYIDKLESLNEKRLETTQKELEYQLDEAKAFNRLRQDLEIWRIENGISQDQ